MAANDWIFEVGVDTTKADTTLHEFVSRATKTLEAIPQITLKANTVGATNVIGAFARDAKTRIAGIGNATIDANTSAASAKITQLSNQIKQLQATAKITGLGVGAGIGSSSSGIRSTTSAIESQTKAVDFLTKAWSYSLLKFAEYEVIAKGIEASIHEFTESLHQASDIQFEQKLQKLYSPDVFKGPSQEDKALETATLIARQYGSDIRDVVQAQGLWTKQTHDLASASYLAAEAEKIHRASGIESLEVYRLTNAMLNQLGGSAAQIPHFYDQMAEAALHMNTVMNNMSGQKSKTEAFKDLFEGAAESAATLKAMHFSDPNDRAAGTLAIVANQVNQVGESGRTASKNLTSMFAALEGKGEGAKTFQKIFGSMSQYKDFDSVIGAMKKHSEELFQAYRNGDLGVKPQQYETLQTFMESLGKIRSIYNDLRKNSAGKLDLVTNEQMQTLQGQTAAAKASLQQLTIAMGQQLLPTAIAFQHFLGSSLLPTLTGSIGTIVGVGKALAVLGVEFVAVQSVMKLKGMFQEMNVQMSASVAVSRQYGIASQGAGVEVDALVAKMQREKLILEDLKQKIAAVQWETGGLADQEKRLGLSIGTVGEIAGGAGVRGLSAFGTAMQGLYGKAVGILRPLLALQMVMGTISAYSSEDGQINAALDSRKADKTHGLNQLRNSAGNLLNNGFGAFDLTGSEGKALNQRTYEMTRDKNIGSATRQTLQDMKDAQAKNDDGALEKAVDRFKGLSGEFGLTKSMKASEKGLGFDMDKIMATLRKVNVGDGAQPQFDFNKPDKAKRTHVPDAYDITRHEFEATKRESQADITSDLDYVKQMQTRIQTLKQHAEAAGWDALSVKRLAGAFNEEKLAMGSAAIAARGEASKLLVDKRRAEGELAKTGPHHTAAHEKAAANLSMISAAYVKASGAARMYFENISKIDAEEKNQVDVANLSAVLRSKKWNIMGTPEMRPPKTLEEFRRLPKQYSEEISQQERQNGLSGGLSEANYNAKMLEGYRSGLDKLYASLKAVGTSDKALIPLKTAINGLATGLLEAVTKAEEFRKKIDSFQQTARDIGEKIAISNTGELGEMLGIPKDEIKVAKDYLEQIKLITDEEKKLQDITEKLGNVTIANAGDQARVDSAKSMVAYGQQELDLKKQLLPELERERNIRDSVAYKAVNSVLDKELSKHLDSTIDRVFGAGKKDTGSINNMLADVSKQIFGEKLKEQVKAFTDKLFNVKPKASDQQKLETMYALHVKGQNRAADIMLAASLNNLTAVGYNGPGAAIAGGASSQPRSGQPGAVFASFTGGSDIANAPKLQMYDANGQPVSEAIGTATHGKETAKNTAQSSNSLREIAMSLGSSGILGMLSSNDAKGGGRIAGMLGNAGGLFGTLSQASDMFLGGAKDANGNNRMGALFAKASGIAGGLGSAFAGAKQGGISGGLETGLGIWQTEASINPLLAASPVGIGIAAAGALFSMLSHHDNPDVMPDKYDKQNYRQSVQDLIGGTSQDGLFSQSDSISKITGGKSEISYIEELFAKGKPANMTQADYDRYVKEFGSSATGAGVLQSDPKNIGQKYITGATGVDGQKRSYEQMQADAQKILQGQAATTLAPIISVNAYGAGPGYKVDPNNLIGFNAGETKAMRETRFKSLPGTQYAQSPYATPGVGTSAPGATRQNPLFTIAASGGTPIQITSQLVVSGQVLAQIVNAVNAQTANRQGNLAA